MRACAFIIASVCVCVCVCALSVQGKADIEGKALYCGRTPLICASIAGHIHTVQALLAAGAIPTNIDMVCVCVHVCVHPCWLLYGICVSICRLHCVYMYVALCVYVHVCAYPCCMVCVCMHACLCACVSE